MPTYEYVCTSCGHEWEFEQSIKEEPQKLCQKCNNLTARRQISRGVGFILKGGGWYADLYSSSSNKEPGKESSKTEGTSDTKSTASSGSTPAKTESTSSASATPSASTKTDSAAAPA